MTYELLLRVRKDEAIFFYFLLSNEKSVLSLINTNLKKALVVTSSKAISLIIND